MFAILRHCYQGFIPRLTIMGARSDAYVVLLRAFIIVVVAIIT